ncbi:glycosyltransferase family 2 protein [Lentibacillus sp. Marseille-P4043]|uniref:glycosyltransferase family 2 protein n=1 Tax=Lentibacillus sp. Marseille-P4043 TaxID=2040293 RepID=UPI000D0B19F0|nr:glycosyltransferase family 2 protein [Lentibacillus sp. Marseille-P4043]
MKDITAILVHYSDKTVLQKALTSLKNVNARLESVIVFQEQGRLLEGQYDFAGQLQFITVKNNYLGNTLNATISRLASLYVLLLQEADYLSPSISAESLQLPDEKTMLGTFYRNRNITLQRPLFLRTSFLKQEQFLSSHQLPFKEALFPARFANVENSVFKDGLLKQARKNSSTNTVERQAFIQKYQLEKIKPDHPSISIIIANYNMGEYVENAIASCLLQNEQPDQILIMDDGSTDGSHDQLKRWSDGEQVTVFSKANEGKAKALNDLLPHVTSDFILELDADDWLDPDAISLIKQYLSDLPKDISVLYGNLRRWKQLSAEADVLFKGVSQGVAVNGLEDLLTYRFPLGPRIYRTSILKKEGGFPVVSFENGRLYEDVSVLSQLIKRSSFCYRDFTVYNIREHRESITKMNQSKWQEFLKMLRSD